MSELRNSPSRETRTSKEPEESVEKIDVNKINEKIKQASIKLVNAIEKIDPNPDYAPMLPKAYFIGGFVRDALLGKQSKDGDLEIFGVSPNDLEKTLIELFGEESIKKAGAAFEVTKIDIGDGLDLDVSIPRTESNIGGKHQDIETEAHPELTITEAAQRRDFTMNAISLDPNTGIIFDPFNGVEDIKKKHIRIVDEKTFTEDPLRVMRAIQFAGRFNFSINEHDKKIMKSMVENGSLDLLPKERMTQEWEKLLLKSENPSVGLELMHELGILERYYPEIFSIIDLQQNPKHHPEGDVWTHTLLSVDSASKNFEPEMLKDDKLTILYSVLAHDLGKVSTTQVQDDGRITSHQHEKAGVEPTKNLLTKFAIPKKNQEKILIGVKHHLRLTLLHDDFIKGNLNEKKFANAVRRLIRDIKPLSFDLYMQICAADQAGRGDTGREYEEGKIALDIIERYDLTEQSKQFITGKDILPIAKKLFPDKKIKGGKWIGDLIKEIEALRDLGEIDTKEDALIVLKEKIKTTLS